MPINKGPRTTNTPTARKHDMSFSNIRLTLAAAVAASLALASAAFAAPLTGAQITETHSGKCLTYTGPTSGTQCYNADGTTQYTDETYGTDSGIWLVQDDTLCVDFASEPGLNCTPISSVDGGLYTDGEYTWSID